MRNFPFIVMWKRWKDSTWAFFLFFLFTLHSLFSQATIPTLQLTEYDSNLMSEIYGQTYFMNSVSAWEETVKYYQGLIRAAWESSADQAIYDYVDSITMSDTYNDVAAYKEYVETALRSQQEAAMNTWEEQANLDLLSNKNEYLARLMTGRVDEIYLDRLTVQSGMATQIQSARTSWENSISDQYFQGINEFSAGANQIQNNYEQTLAALDASDAVFQNNLQQIDLYKKNVETAISSMLTGFQTDLDTACNSSIDCAYRYANQGSLNDAGKLLQKYITDIKAELNKPATETTFSLTNLSKQINTFLSDQRVFANGKSNTYDKLTYTFQTGITPKIIEEQSLQNVSLLDQKTNDVRYLNFDYWSLLNGETQWSTLPDREFTLETIGTYSRNGTADIVNAILNKGTFPTEQASIKHLIQSKLGSGLTIQGDVMFNLLTKDKSLGNKHIAGDLLAWVSVSKGAFDCGFGCNNASQAFQGNMLVDQAQGVNYQVYRLNRPGFYNEYRMDHITYAIKYNVHDATSESHATYWKGISGSMGKQFDSYSKEITPAISAWETQVNEYRNFYNTWKIEATQARLQAKVDFESSMASLDTNRQTWMAKIQDEYQAGSTNWTELETKSRSVADASALASLQSNIQTAMAPPTLTTGVSQVLESYQSSLNTLSAREVGNTSLFDAANTKSIATSISIGGKDISQIFQLTTNGIYQYSQLMSINENNDRSAVAEQEKILNQQVYGIRWDSRAVAKFGDDGQYTGDAKFRDILKDLTNSKKYESTIATCNAANDATRNCFNEAHAVALKQLKDIDANLEFQDGMIVKSFDMENRIKLNLFNKEEFAALSKADQARAGSCYANPASCGDLLRKDFDLTFDKNTKLVTLSKLINNGRVEGKNEKGEYFSGKETQSRSFTLASVKPVTAPKNKDLFDVWGNEDWKDVSAQANEVMNQFFSKSLTADTKAISFATTNIRSVESTNERKFQKEKQAREAHDSLIKDLLIAYISGGMAGVKGAIKNKVEDQINTSLAEAWAKATGADDDQIAALTQAVSFMRGKMAEKKIKSNMAQNNIANAGMAVVAGGMMFATGGMSSVLLANSPMAAMNSFAGGVGKMAGAALSAMNPMTLAFGQAGMGLVSGATAGIYRAVAGDKAADAMMNRMTGPKDRLAAIKANEQAIIQSNVTQAVATSTGLPAEVIGNIITDYKGAQAAKKVRNAVNANPIANISSQVAGAVGGIIKTAIVATGVPERDIQRALSEGNAHLYANVNDRNLQTQSLAYSSQMLGMKAPGTSYTSATPTLKDKKGLVKELGQRAAVDALSVGMTKEEKEVLNAAFRKGYGAMEQSKADKKARTEAVRSTVVTAVTTAVTLGAASGFSVLGNIGQTVSNGINAVSKFLGSGFTMAAGTATQVGAATVNAGIQMIDGARNGIDGIMAGFANGALGVFTAGGAFDFGKVTDEFGKVVGKSTLGLGVSYDRQNGYGGMIGVGGAAANASISFSQRGNTTISGSMNTGFRGVQLTASSTTNGEQTIGANFNPSNEGPRKGWNIGANYDLNGGGASANIGYTDPNSGLGLTSTIDRNGLSTSSSLNGNNYGTMTADGYTADEFNWAQNNINLAQNRTDDLAREANTKQTLRDSNYSDAEIDTMSPQEQDATANRILRDREDTKLRNADYTDEDIAKMSQADRERNLDRIEGVASVDNFTAEGIANAALGVVGAFAGFAGFAFAGGTNGSNVPNRSHAETPEMVARRKEEEDGDDVAVGKGKNGLPDEQVYDVDIDYSSDDQENNPGTSKSTVNTFDQKSSHLILKFKNLQDDLAKKLESAAEPKERTARISEFIDKLNRLPQSELMDLMRISAERQADNKSLVALDPKVGSVVAIVPDQNKPAHFVFKLNDTATRVKGELIKSVSESVAAFRDKNPLVADRTALFGKAEIEIGNKSEVANQRLNEAISSPEYRKIEGQLRELQIQIEDNRSAISEAARNWDGTLPANKADFDLLIGQMKSLERQFENAQKSYDSYLKPYVDAASTANGRYNELIYGKNDSKNLGKFEAKSKEFGKKIAQDQEVRRSLETELKVYQALLSSHGNLPLESSSLYKDKVTQLQKDLKKVTDRIASSEKSKVAADAEKKKIHDAVQKYGQDRLAKQEAEYKKQEKVAAAKSIAENPLLKNQLSQEFRDSVNRIQKAEVKAAELILRSTESPTDREAYDSAMNELRNARSAFENNFGVSMDGVVRTLGNEGGDPEKGISSLKGILKKGETLTAYVPGKTMEKAIPFYVNETTGEFRIGETKHQEPMTYVEMAASSFKQTRELQHLESILTGNEIKNTTLSESEAAYLRSRWCVAVSTWGMLKRDFGDTVPDLVPFIKEINDRGWIDSSNMELKATDSIVNHYAAASGGKFDRISLVSEKPDSPVRNRAERYEALGQFLKDKHPEAITLRVKDDNGKGHTISLQRNIDGKYTVVDTAQPTVNGSIFDPENVKDSLLGKKDSSNPYAQFDPKGFDYVKK